ncbi:MAG: helix-turn-helix domain-containing protein [Balneolaceae bacterium]|nr:helix-turn-helix domain-containing protein [Balneolaceae bacterium]
MKLSVGENTVNSQEQQFLSRLDALVNDRIGEEELSVEEISRELGVSTSTFYRKVKEETGLSPVEYIRERKLSHAADLLSTDFGNVSEVAYEAGFNNLSYFSKCFKEKYGINPGRYSKLRLYRKSHSHYLTSFVGREEEVDELKMLIGRNRLVNLTGPAGTGKTRTALEVLKHLEGRYDDSVAAVHLASITDPDLVPSAILQSLQVPEHPLKPALETLADQLQSRELLLLLDNFEHVFPAAPKINKLLEQCPGLSILVTSRVVLNLTGEIQYPLSPLATPEPVETVEHADLDRICAYPAIRLFKDRAGQVNTEFDVDIDNATDVIAICRKLDGLPLALELAAAQIKLVSPAELLKRLEAGLSILKSEQLDRTERHDSLTRAIAWSYDLLDEQGQRYFQKLALIPGDFGLPAAEALWKEFFEGDFFTALRSLSDKNLVQSFEEEGAVRFRLLETLKVFGRNKLSGSNREKRAVRALASHYLEMVREAETELNGPDQKQWLQKLNRELDNLRGILGYLDQQREVKLGLQLSTHIWRFWMMQGLNKEAKNWLLRFTNLASRMKQNELTNEINELRGKALSTLGNTELFLTENEASEKHLRESLTVFRKLGNLNDLAINLNHYGWTLSTMGYYDKSVAMTKEAKRLHEKLGNRRGISVSLCNLAFVSCCRGELVYACEQYEEGISIREEIGDLRGIAYLSTRLARVEQHMGDFDAAFSHLEKAHGILHDLNEIQLIAWHDTIKGLTCYNYGMYEKAKDLQDKAITGWTEVGNRWGIGYSCDLNGLVLLALNYPQDVRSYLDKAADIWDRVSCRFMDTLSNYCYGEWEAYNKNLDRARELHAAALKSRIEYGIRLLVPESLEALAGLFMKIGEPERAVAFLSAASTLRKKIKAPMPPRFEEEYEQIISRCRTELDESTFEKYWKNGEQMGWKKLGEMV